MERSSVFIQTSPNLFQNEPESVPDQLNQAKVADIKVRRERQTFTRLPKSNAILFTVRTYMTPLTALEDTELLALRSQIWGWEEEIKTYKGWAIWGDTVERWCEDRLGKRDENIKANKVGCPI